MGKMLDDFLFKHKKDKSSISKSLYDKLLLAEEAILTKKQNTVEAKKTITLNSINATTIAKTISISRKTIYNNELLRFFIEENSTTDGNESKEEIDKLKAKLNDIETKFNKMVNRDIDSEILRHQIDTLQAELEQANKRIISLEKQHEEDLRKMNKSVIKTTDLLN